jgi:hypothetical protein
MLPSVSLSATSIQGGTFPKAVTVTANVAGTVYFAEGDFVVKTVSDITSSPSYRWAKGIVTSTNTPTSIAIDVDAITNGYYRVFVADSKGVLSAPAINIVTISVTRASTATTVALACATGGACAIGDVGPGGGVVFILSTTTGNTTGLTFEAARNDWNGSAPDGTVKWCSASYVSIGGLGTAIGTGSTNSATIATTCVSTGTNDGAEYIRGKTIGGKSDWFLPSGDEAMAIYTQRSVFTGSYATNQTSGDAARYLSSSQGANTLNALGLYMEGSGAPGTNGELSKDWFFAVRPVRSFTAGS